MAVEFKLPDLGEGIEEADVLKVLVAEGDEVQVDQPLLEIETEKATLEVPSTVAGRVSALHVSEGETIHPGQLVLSVEEAGAAAASEEQPRARVESVAPEAEPAESAAAPEERRQAMEQAEPEGETERAPEVADAAGEAEAAAEPAEAEAPAHREAAEPPPTRAEPPPATVAAAPPPAPAAEGEQPVFASPSVRRFAREIGVDVREVAGTGPGGRISEDDVKQHARGRMTAPPPAPPAEQRPAAARGPLLEPPPLPDFTQWGEVERQPLTRLRRTVARNMATSWAHIPHVTLEHWADITAVEEMRQEYKERAREAGGNLTISVVMIKIAAAALKAHPRFNSSLDLETNELILKRHYHIGVAVDTERGLVVPVLRDVDEKNIVQLSVELNDIAERARNNELSLEEMRGATFTVTNLGSFGTAHFSPIINHPEVAVLGLGRAERLPVWEGERWVPRLRMPFSVTFDHRVVDGADAARFASWIADAVDHPLMMAFEG